MGRGEQLSRPAIGLERGVEASELEVEARGTRQAGGEAARIADLFPDANRLLVVLERNGDVAPADVRVSHVAQDPRLLAAIAQLPLEGERVPIGLKRTCLIVEAAARDAQVIESQRQSGTVAVPSRQRGRALEPGQRTAMRGLDQVRPANHIQHVRFARGIVIVPARVERPAEALQRLDEISLLEREISGVFKGDAQPLPVRQRSEHGDGLPIGFTCLHILCPLEVHPADEDQRSCLARLVFGPLLDGERLAQHGERPDIVPLPPVGVAD